jgi:hypothetical protein
MSPRVKSAEERRRNAERMRDWRKRNPEKVRAYHKKAWASNPERGRAANRKTYWKDPEKHRDRQRRREYGLAPGQYTAMVAAQGNLCAICAQPETVVAKRGGGVRNLAIDHCHASGKIRELLCSRCNWILGGAQDRIELLEKAIAYLRRHGVA